MKKIAICILACTFVFGTLVGYSEELNEEIGENIVRLHIVADSNDAEAQEVKLKVRDALLEEMKKYENKKEVENALPYLEAVAERVLYEEGFSYGASAEMGRFDFPTKRYENFVLPKGEYEAVRIRLGEGAGENWWCVLFPPLCMIDAATDESKALLRETFGENYDLVTGDEKLSVQVKFKIAELF